MTRLAKMAELVHDDVLEHVVGPKQQPPREREVAATRARAPACARVADADRLVLVPEPLGLPPHDIRYSTARLAAVRTLDGRRRILGIGGKDPAATFLTQVARVDSVERIGRRSGLYRLVAS